MRYANSAGVWVPPIGRFHVARSAFRVFYLTGYHQAYGLATPKIKAGCVTASGNEEKNVSRALLQNLRGTGRRLSVPVILENLNQADVKAWCCYVAAWKHRKRSGSRAYRTSRLCRVSLRASIRKCTWPETPAIRIIMPEYVTTSLRSLLQRLLHSVILKIAL